MEFITLSEKFYKKYENCSEIERKNNRPYILTIIEYNGVTFAIPLRSHIKHKYAFWTDKENGCGLDFTKAVVILNKKDIIRNNPQIRQKEYNVLKGKDTIVQQKLVQYINVYKKAKSRIDVPRNKIICDYSTLKYFELFI